MTEFIESWFLVALVASRDAAVLALAVGGLLLLLGKRLAPGWRHALWMLVAVRLLIPVLPTSPMSWQQWLPEPILETAAPASPETAEKPEAVAANSRPLISPISVASLPKSVESSRSSIVTKPNKASPAPALDSPPPAPSLSWQNWLAIGWAAGVFAFLTVIATVTVRFRRRTRRLTIDAGRHPEIRALLADIAQEHGIRRTPRLRVTEAVSSPALTGLFRPEILLPPAVANDLSSGELRLILLHELGHLDRRDVWTNWVLSLLQAIHWFNPLVWWAFRRTRIEAERACDAWVLQRTGRESSEDYGQALIRLLKSSAKRPPVPGVVGVIESRRDLRRRIALIGRFSGKRNRLAVAGAAVLFAALAATGLTRAPAGNDDQADAEKRDAATEETVTLECLVVSPDGTPVSGAEVFLRLGLPQPNRRVSDADGLVRFEVDADWAGDHRTVIPEIFARKSGLGSGSLFLLPNAPSPSKIILTKGKPLEIRVVDEKKNPVSGLEVRVAAIFSRDLTPRLQNVGDPPRLPDGFWNAVTDENGSARIDELPDDVWVYLDHNDPRFAQVPGWHMLPMYHNPALGEVVKIRLTPAATIRGTVNDPAGKPAAGIIVHAFGGGGRLPQSSKVEAVTDAEGHYTLQRLLPTAYTLWAELPEGPAALWVSPVLKDIGLKEREIVEELNIELVKGTLVTGKVTLDDSGEPARDVTVRAKFEGFSPLNSLGTSTKTAEDGIYRLRLPPGEGTVSVSHFYPGYAAPLPDRFLITAEEGGSHTADFVFRKTRGFTGIVTDEKDQPVAGATVRAQFPGSKLPFSSPREVLTETDGSFEITPPGKVSKVILAASDRERKRVFGPIEVDDDSFDDHKLVLRPGEFGRVEGTVSDEQGNPVPDAGIDIYYDLFSSPSTVVDSMTYTDENGKFAVERVWPDQSFRIDAEKAGYFFDDPSKGYSVQANKTIEVNFLLIQRTETVEGVVIDHEGKPVTGARVGLLAKDEYGKSKETDQNGSFRFEGLLKGEVRITASKITPDFATKTETQTKTESEDPVKITLPRTDGKIGGVIVDRQGKPLRNARLFLLGKERSGSTDEQGRFEIGGIMPGPVTLTIFPNFSEHERGRSEVPMKTGQLDARIVFSPEKEKPQETELTEIVAESSVVDEGDNQAIFTGGVMFRHGDFTLECDELIVSLRPGALSKKLAIQIDEAIQKAEAKGAVTVTLRKENGEVHTGSGGRALFDPDSQHVILSESPRLQAGNKLIQGSPNTIIILQVNGQHQVKETSIVKVDAE